MNCSLSDEQIEWIEQIKKLRRKEKEEGDFTSLASAFDLEDKKWKIISSLVNFQ